MRMIAAKELYDGMVLGKSIYSYNNKLLLAAGYRLTRTIKDKLSSRGYNHLYIMEEGTEDVIPEDIISDEVRYQARAKLTDKAEQVNRFFQFKDLSRSRIYDLLHSNEFNKINITYDMKKVVNEIIEDISSVGATFLNTILFKAEDTYYLDHALNVAILSILIGKKYQFTKSELLDLATGGFLHDFGKIILEKMKESLNTKAAEELMKEHPTFGYILVSQSLGSSPTVNQVINQHHENQDGTGYPVGLEGENLPPTGTVQRNTKGKIFRYAEICSVADAYDKMVMNPKRGKQLFPAEAMKELIMKAGTFYNKHIINTFISIIPHYPVGAYVKIKNILDTSFLGYRGVVAKINENSLNNPVIILLQDRSMKRITPRQFDTSKVKTIELELIL